ncbi:unnamed protein product [Caenorhabditis brenneri]
MPDPPNHRRSSSRTRDALKKKQKRSLDPDPQGPPRKIAERRSSDKENVKKEPKKTPPPKGQDPKTKVKRRTQEDLTQAVKTPKLTARKSTYSYPTPPESSESSASTASTSDVAELSTSFGNIRIKFDKLPEEWIQENWWLPQPKTEHVAVFHRPVTGAANRVITLEPDRVQSPHDYIQLMHVIQSFVHQLNQLPTYKFEKLIEKVDRIVRMMYLENKSRVLNLHVIHMDYHLYHTFSSMMPNQECDEEAVYTRPFFKMLRSSVEEHYQNDEKTKMDMLEIVDINIGSLRQFGEKMVIPCARIVERFEAFVDEILKESRER